MAKELDANVVAVDFAGHGKSFHRDPGSRYNFTDYIVDTGVVCAAMQLCCRVSVNIRN